MENIVRYSIGVDSPVTPSDPLPPLPEIPCGAIVVIEGRAPIWRYGLAFNKLYATPALVIATYDPRLGAVVISCETNEYKEGDVIDIKFE